MRSERLWNNTLVSLLVFLVTIILLTGCAAKQTAEATEAKEPVFPMLQPVPAESGMSESDEKNNMIYAHANKRILEILPADNSSAEAFLELLGKGDVTVEMHDYGSFEKVGTLDSALPRNDGQISTEPGDLILYRGNQITIYYDRNSWNLTRLGRIQGVTQKELKEILGTGHVVIRFSLSEKQETAMETGEPSVSP